MNDLPAFPNEPPEGPGYVPVPLEQLEVGKYYFAKRRTHYLDDYLILRIEKTIEGYAVQYRAFGVWNPERDDKYKAPANAAGRVAWSMNEEIVVPDLKPRGISMVFKVPANDAMEIGGRRRRRAKKTRKARKLKRKQTRRHRK